MEAPRDCAPFLFFPSELFQKIVLNMSYVGRTAVLTHSMFSIETQQKLHRAEFGMQRNTQTLFIRNESEIYQIPCQYQAQIKIYFLRTF